MYDDEKHRQLLRKAEEDVAEVVAEIRSELVRQCDGRVKAARQVEAEEMVKHAARRLFNAGFGWDEIEMILVCAAEGIMRGENI